MATTATDPTGSRADQSFMAAALALASRGLGRVAPNPAVGCIIVKEDRIVGRGWTQPGGRPHAETEALARAGAAARGATAYVTLEPCAHHGQTPPCAEALVGAGISRCLVALEDPDPRVAGRGLEILRAAGVEVESGLCRAAAAELNAGFLLRQQEGRPLVTLKLATSLDGRIATPRGESQWITGPAARAQGHRLRATHDAVLVGSGTAVADNPRLDVRLPGQDSASPLRVVLDGRLRVPLTHDLVARAPEQPTWLFTREDADGPRQEAYAQAGVEVIPLGLDGAGRLSLKDALQTLGARGLTRVLVEGGGQLAAGLLQEDLVDALVWFHSASVIGGDGLAGIAGLGLERLGAAPAFERCGILRLESDLMESFRRRL